VWHCAFNGKDRGSIFVWNAATCRTCRIERCSTWKVVVQHFPSVHTPSLVCSANCSWDVNHSATLGVVGAPYFCKLVWFRFVLVKLNGRFSYQTVFFFSIPSSVNEFFWEFFTTLSVSETISSMVVWCWLMKYLEGSGCAMKRGTVDGRMMVADELESIWKGAAVAWSETLLSFDWSD